MRFLIDNSLSPLLASLLADLGHDSVHLRDLGLEDASDHVVMEAAGGQDRVLVSADSDFGRILALGRQITPSVILLREGKPYEPELQVELLMRFLEPIQAAVSQRSFIVFKDGRIRTRRLPISGD